MNDKTDPADELRQALQEALGEFRGYAQTLAQDDALRKAITPAGELDITQEIRQMALHEAQAAHRAEDQTREAFAYLIVLASLTSRGTSGATLNLGQATKQKLGLLKTAAIAQLRVGRLRLGALVLEQVLPRLRQLVKVKGQKDLADNLTAALNTCCDALRILQRLPEATEVLDEATRIILEILVDQRARASTVLLAANLHDYSSLLREQNRLVGASVAAGESVRILRRTVVTRGQDGWTRYWAYLAEALMNLGDALYKQNKQVEALQALKETVSIFHRLVEDEGQTQWIPNLAAALITLGAVLRRQGELPGAIGNLAEAVCILRCLVENKGQTQWTHNLAAALVNLGAALEQESRLSMAAEVLEEAVAALHRLIDVSDPIQRWVHNAAAALNNLGNTWLQQNKLTEAVGALRDAAQTLNLTPDPAWDTPSRALFVSANVLRCYQQFAQTSRPPIDVGIFNELARAFERAVEFRSIEDLRGEMSDNLMVGGSTLTRLSVFIDVWLGAFVAAGQWRDAAAVVTRAHARRLETLQLARMYAQRDRADLPEGQKRFFERLAQFYALEMRLVHRTPFLTRPHSDSDDASGDGVGAWKPGGGRLDVAFEFNQSGHSGRNALELECEAVLRELRALRSDLIRDGLMPDPQQWRRLLDEHVSQLQPQQAMAVVVIPVDYGVAPQEDQTRLALVGRDFSTALPVTNLPALSAAMHAASVRPSSRSGVRKGAEDSEAVTGESKSGSAATIDRHEVDVDRGADLVERMRQTIWAPLQTELTQHGITELLMFTHGESHVLPWIASAPAELNFRLYPSLHMRTPSRSAAVTLPDEDTPLYVLANDAREDTNPTRRLWYADLEVQTLRLLHDPENKGIVQKLSHPRHVKRRGMVWAIGHGDHAHEGQEGNAMLSCGSPPDEPGVAPFAFIDHGQAMPAVVASACLVGRVKDVEHEPMGLPTVLSLGEVGLIAGSLVAVDDLFASVFALSVNSHWRHAAQARSHGGDLRQAMLDAQRELQCGNWSEHVLQDFRHVCRQALPMVLSAICQTTLDQHSSLGGASGVQHRQLSRAITAQIEMLRDDWGLCNEGSISGVTHLAARLAAEPQAVADEAIGYFLAHRNSDNLRSRAQALARFWTIIG